MIVSFFLFLIYLLGSSVHGILLISPIIVLIHPVCLSMYLASAVHRVNQYNESVSIHCTDSPIHCIDSPCESNVCRCISPPRSLFIFHAPLTHPPDQYAPSTPFPLVLPSLALHLIPSTALLSPSFPSFAFYLIYTVGVCEKTQDTRGGGGAAARAERRFPQRGLARFTGGPSGPRHPGSAVGRGTGAGTAGGETGGAGRGARGHAEPCAAGP